MNQWVPYAILLAYAVLVTLLALAGVFSETDARRDAAYKVLRVLLPWGLITIGAQAVTAHLTGP